MLRTTLVKKFFGVNSYFPGTILYKQNFKTEVQKVRAVFVDTKKPEVKVEETTDKSMAVNIEQQKKPVIKTENKPPVSPVTSQTAQVFLNKPKKSKLTKNKKSN